MSYNPRNPRSQDGEPDDSWTSPTLAELGLDDVLSEGETPFDTSQPPTQIAVRAAPPGFRSICRTLGKEYDMSYSKFVRLALKHGAAIFDADPRMQNLKDAHKRVAALAMDSGDTRALVRLDQVQSYPFASSEEIRTTLSTFFWVHGLLSDLAHVCGSHVSRLAVAAIMVSLQTLPNERGYRRVILREVDTFWDVVERRTRELGLDLEGGAS